jgi:hypothetical protein
MPHGIVKTERDERLLVVFKGWPGERERHAEAAKRGWQKRQRRSSRPAYDRPTLDQTHKRWKLTFGRHLGLRTQEVLHALGAKPSSPREYRIPRDASPRVREVVLRWAEGDNQAVADFYHAWTSEQEQQAAAERDRQEALREAGARWAERERLWVQQRDRAKEAARIERAEKRRQHAERIAAMPPEERERYEAGKARRRERDARRRRHDRFVRRWVAHCLYMAPDPGSRRYEYDSDRYIDDLAEHCGREADQVVDTVEAGKLDSDTAICILNEIKRAAVLPIEDLYADARVGEAMAPAWERLTGEKNSRYEAVAQELGMPVDSRTVARVIAEEITMEEAQKIAERIRFRHKNTDYEELLRQGYSKEDARAMMQYRGRQTPDTH